MTPKNDLKNTDTKIGVHRRMQPTRAYTRGVGVNPSPCYDRSTTHPLKPPHLIS